MQPPHALKVDARFIICFTPVLTRKGPARDQPYFAQKYALTEKLLCLVNSSDFNDLFFFSMEILFAWWIRLRFSKMNL